MLSEKLMNSLIKDLYFKDLLDNSSLLNYQIYNTKFNEWVDIDDLESFKLSDGVILKAVVGLLQRKRKKASKNQGKEKKQKLNFNSEVQSEHSQSERMLLDDSVENKYQNTTESLENRRDKLFQELTNSDSKSQNITTQRDQSEYESRIVTPNTNYLDGLKDFIECVTNKKNLLKNIDIESIVSKEKIVNYESNDTLVKKNIRESTFNLVIPPQLSKYSDHIVKHFLNKSFIFRCNLIRISILCSIFQIFYMHMQNFKNTTSNFLFLIIVKVINSLSLSGYNNHTLKNQCLK